MKHKPAARKPVPKALRNISGFMSIGHKGVSEKTARRLLEIIDKSETQIGKQNKQNKKCAR
jgi:hypothetical protein